ncbi:MAG: PepSY domain-containing protein, partial [Acidobacteriia bacterium]|nr:PepSY domain-containing protein [Terriglobia bacterium]
WRRINYDLHSAVGFWTLIAVSLWAISGMYFAWPRQAFQLVDALSPIVSARPPAVTVRPDPNAVEPDLAKLLERASKADPGTTWAGLVFPYSRRAPLEVIMRRGRARGREYEDTLYFNPYTGEHLAIWRYGINQSLGDWLIWAQVPLHFGTFWGLGVKFVWAAAGLAIPLLAITGLLMYWNRSLRRKWRRLRLERVRLNGRNSAGIGSLPPVLSKPQLPLCKVVILSKGSWRKV